MVKSAKTAALITGRVELQPGIFSLWLKEEEIAKAAKPGQFVMVYLKNSAKVLPRPISICDTDPEGGLFRLVFRIAGEGTKELSCYRPGDSMEVLGPLGNGFLLPQKEETALVVGGGIGIPPLLALAKQLKGRKEIVLGYRNADTFLREEFESCGTVRIATDDGSLGVQGNVLKVLEKDNRSYEMIYACGPLPMLRGIKQFAEALEIPAQISMEERMACGIGACLACVCKSKDKDPHTNVLNKRVCKDGPVFFADTIEI